MSDQHWSGKRSITSYEQDEQPTNPRQGDLWLDTDDNTGEDKVEVYTSNDNWRRNKKWKWGPGADYGYTIGGSSSFEISNIERITFPFESGTASIVGNLNSTRRNIGTSNSSTNSYTYGGYDGTNYLSLIERFSFPFDSGTVSNIGNLTGRRRLMGSCNSSLHGYTQGGQNAGVSRVSIIDRITFSSDGDATQSGGIVANIYFLSGNNSSTHGYNCGGRATDSGASSYTRIDRITFPFDSGNASTVGNIGQTYTVGNAACNSSKYGFTSGGYDGSTGNYINNIERFEFPFDSGTSIFLGDVAVGNLRSHGSCNSSKNGYTCGGVGSSYWSSIDRFDFSLDSGNAINVGNLTTTRNTKAIDGVDFVSMLI